MQTTPLPPTVKLTEAGRQAIRRRLLLTVRQDQWRDNWPQAICDALESRRELASVLSDGYADFFVKLAPARSVAFRLELRHVEAVA